MKISVLHGSSLKFTSKFLQLCFWLFNLNVKWKKKIPFRTLKTVILFFFSKLPSCLSLPTQICRHLAGVIAESARLSPTGQQQWVAGIGGCGDVEREGKREKEGKERERKREGKGRERERGEAAGRRGLWAAAGADAGKVSAGFDGEGEADGGLGNFFSYFALELKSQKQSFNNLLFFLGGGLMYGFMIHPILKFKTRKCRK